MSDLWFSINASELTERYGAAVNNPESENRHSDRDGIDWPAVGTAVRRLFCLTDPGVAGADPQGNPSSAAIAEVAAGLGPAEEKIVRSWLSEPPDASIDFHRADRWGVTNGRHRLTGVWSVHPEWDLPIRMELKDPSIQPAAAAANELIDEAIAWRDSLDRDVELPDNSVNRKYRTGLDAFASYPRQTVQLKKPRLFNWSGSPAPQQFTNVNENHQVFVWTEGEELLLVIESSAAMYRDQVFTWLSQVKKNPGNEALSPLLAEAQTITVLAAVMVRGNDEWHKQTFTKNEFSTAQEIERTAPTVSEFVFHSVTWSTGTKEGCENR